MEISIDKERFSELAAEASSAADLGGDNSRRGITVAINDRPIALRYFDICEAFKIAPQFDSLIARFDIYLVPHSVSIIRRSGFSEIVTFGMEVEYLVSDQTCSILGLFPNSKWTTWGEIGVSSHAEAGAGDSEKYGDGWASASAGALRVRAQANGSLGIRWAEKVITPEISAIGIGSSRCEWQFEKRDEPLFGRDMQTWSLIATSRRMRHLQHRCRYYYVSRTAFIPSRVESDWTDLTCELPARTQS